jgi:pimeloyl-ACP methyl ester carboxylesterase
MFWSGPLGRLILGLLLVLAATVGGAIYLLHSVTHPARDTAMLDPADLLLQAEEVTFRASDGLLLSGWFIRGRSDLPVIILCHDLGGSRSSLLNHAVSLNRAGFPMFLFDFRGHARSGGRGASLGVAERLDVLGAIDYLKARRNAKTVRFGVWGVGMGGYAAVLAAIENRQIDTLALDDLYGEVGIRFEELLRDRVPPPLHFLVAALRPFYGLYFGLLLDRFSVARSLPGLADRDFLFIVRADPPDRYLEGKALYAALPESVAGDRNLLALRTSASNGLYADEKREYDEAIVRFFSSHLRSDRPTASGRPGSLEVIER